MKKVLPGVKPPRIPGVWHLSDLLPDPARPALADVRDRNLFLSGELESTHTTLAVSDEATAETDGMPQRLRSVEVGAVAGGTVTVQVQVNGVDAFDDASRPVSGAGPSDVSSPYVFPAGTSVVSVIEATTGVPTGEANVVIETEPYILRPRRQPVELRGKDRLRVSKRKAARAANIQDAPTERQRQDRQTPYRPSSGPTNIPKGIRDVRIPIDPKRPPITDPMRPF